MAVATQAEKTVSVPPRGFTERLYGYIVWGGIALVLIWSWGPAEMVRFLNLFTDASNMADYAGGFLSPNFRDWHYYVEEMILTVQIAVWGTVLAIVVGIPFALLSSSNIAPIWIVQPVRRLMDATRAINELVFAVLFVTAVGLGPFAGVMALFVHNTGIIAKLFSEAVEAVDPRPVEGIRATGATRLQEIVFGVVPQVAPLWISFSLYRFETNVRQATVLGIVGAGGIGQVLFESIRSFLYAETAAIILIVIVTVSIVDILSAQLRKVVI
ncbi:phosphonate ABC transporter, permease protein PhnE [Afifella marina]|uniref:Phosphonate transport system permease protein n=1 Tax=Afifella marina DSM 2698 TaxID=1120955 RepID=A0A1G5MU23_AFIMA|nr:phosphonate ABC transporter, permease protein PhnE [Afifella marina]MBK1621992.1 phosphonate ABC transporter, permease protein PhnE [Afifella marina DSM 2698]MBK1627785.1 phosphonate ABC transporter, permease protein PhnE [Afifella marina]MBK5916752.1 phosphonate ABC transporter, permease protein PhnE [Afifella marina]RAI19922.1 phosphonate ABC transporter, permease protein PhnE [Afifella marina DSM 2698]SCZ28685.1 phosphonate transport system permease protein [Afifella marina DSM 2698]